MCVDCQFPNRTIACRAHFALVGRALTRLRLDKERPPPSASLEERKRVLKEAVERHFDRVCCATVDGEEQCHRRFCELHARKRVHKRAAYVTRRLIEAQHPTTEEFGVAHQLGIDVLDASLHHDPDCRPDASATAAPGELLMLPSRAECYGRSILHHASQKHGISQERILEAMQQAGVDFDDVLKGIAHVTGVLKDPHASGGTTAHHPSRTTADDHAAAADLLRASQHRQTQSQSQSKPRRQSGRRMQEHDDRELGEHAQVAGAMQQALMNSSTTIHRRLMSMDRTLAKHTNAHLRIHKTVTPRPDQLDWHTAKHAVVGPLASLLALSTEQGSVFERFAPGVVGLNSVRSRLFHALEKGRRRLSAHHAHHAQRRRELQANAQKYEPLFQHFEAKHARRDTLELPRVHALSWVHEVVDVKYWASEAQRLLEVERARLQMREAGGTTAKERAERHPTGYAWLDHGHPPTAMGDAMRRMLYRKTTGVDPPWHEPSVRRRLHARGVPSQSGLRRLTESFFDGTLAAPFAFTDSFAVSSGALIKESDEGFFQATLRYVIGGTVGCYFTAPVSDPSRTQGGGEGEQPDGETLKVLRPSEEKLCFPAVSCATLTGLPPPTLKCVQCSAVHRRKLRVSVRSSHTTSPRSAPGAMSPTPSGWT